MANENDGVLSNNFSKNSSNYNNNETETQFTTTVSQSTVATTIEGKRSGSAAADYRHNRPSGVDVLSMEQPRREDNPFSFKHFLNRDTSAALGSSSNSNICVSISGIHSNASLSTAPAPQSTEQCVNHSNNNSSSLNDDHSTIRKASIITSTNLLPQYSPVVATGLTTLTSLSSSTSSYQCSTGARPKVPQASTSSSQRYSMASPSVSVTSISSLSGEASKMKRSPRFPSFDSQASLAECSGGNSNASPTNRACVDEDVYDIMHNFLPNSEFDQRYVHRSYSNYDMDVPGSHHHSTDTSSPRRRTSPVGPGGPPDDGGFKRPTSPNVGLKINISPLANPSRSQPHRHPSNVNSGNSGNNHMMGSRSNTEFSAVLPDFVQDHLVLEQWYSDMNVNSHPNSPVSSADFIEDRPGMGNSSEKCQTLPDFLSDGPIIHSASSRLADVAAGLPDLDSPEENSPGTQLARLRLENDRLRRELDESRLALAEQTRRSGELERRLDQARSSEKAYNANIAQSMINAEESLDRSNKRAAAAQNQVTKLKQQVKQLTAEIQSLHRENESLREDGAVGGRERVTRRPLRNQQISRDLRRAATNAENNLRQLLTGVENLRLMAATIENMDHMTLDSNNQSNPNSNDEFTSDCDVDFDDRSGPAL